MASYEIDKIMQVQKVLFLVPFEHLQDEQEVVKRGIYYFDAKLFLVKVWNLEMDLKTEDIKTLPVWIQFQDLDVKFWEVPV